MKTAFNHKDLSAEIFGGCSGITWDTNDHQHLWGRNYGLHRVRTSHVIFMPRQQTYYLSGNSVEHPLVTDSLLIAKYASLGMGTMIFQSTSIMYEAINECGVMGGQFFMLIVQLIQKLLVPTLRQFIRVL